MLALINQWRLTREWHRFNTCFSIRVIRKTTKQHIVDGTEQANSMLSSNSCIVKKAFQITGFSNVLGGLEDNLIHDDTVCKEIAEIMIFL